MLEILRQDKDSKVLVVTPLLPTHSISKITKKTIKRNDTPITWISFSSNSNIPTNTQNGMNEYGLKHKLPQFIFMLDNDIELGRHMIDRMVNKLEGTPDYIAYCYCSFEFKGFINRTFSAINFDGTKLLQHNYISSNSLIKLSHLNKIDGLVTDAIYTRLLDYVLWLKFLKEGFIGIPCPEAHFIAYSTEDSISAGSINDYNIKYKRVYYDFISPIIEKFSKKSSS